MGALNRWEGYDEKDDERWVLEIENDRMSEGAPQVVTVWVEYWDDPRARAAEALACLTPEQALEAAEALKVYAERSRVANGG